MGGTIAKLVKQGHEVCLLDMTDGEPTPYGDPETRAAEAAKAAEKAKEAAAAQARPPETAPAAPHEATIPYLEE